MTQKFEVGMVLAGTVPAGACTAGVLDFLIEALDTWERANASNETSPPTHEVALKAVGG